MAYPDALIVAAADGKVVLANPSAASLLGYSVDELVGLEIDQLVSDKSDLVIMGSRAAAWVGRGSTSGQTAVPVPRNCARSCVPPARAARCSAIEAYSASCTVQRN